MLRKLFAQSAMEYLMTYGWAILIMVVVLAGLLQMGVLNSYTFTPKAQTGSCSIYRPYGAHNSNLAVKKGVCTNEIPQYVAYFNGATSSLTGNFASTTGPVTINMWISESSGPTNYNQYYLVWGNMNTHSGFTLRDSWPRTAFACISSITNTAWGQFFAGYPQGKPNVWYMATAEYDTNAQTINLYLNGVLQSTTPITGTFSPLAGVFTIHNSTYAVDLISNVQFYNTTLSANDIKNLYYEGIGGAPIQLNHIVGWWPLNNDVNDYSGNNYAGTPSNVIFTSTWTNGYTIP